MPRAYSDNLRWRMVWAFLYQQEDISSISSRLYVSEKTVRRVIDLYLSSGNVCPKKQRSGPPRKLSDREDLLILDAIFENPGIYLDELQSRLKDVFGTEISLSVICQTVKNMGLTRQRLKHVVVRRSEEERAKFMIQVQGIPASCFVWVDETGSDRRNSFRKTGYGIRGIPPVSFKINIGSKRISAISCMSTNGIEDIYLVEGSVDGDIFLEFLQHCLLPILQPFNGVNQNSIVILDNASIHYLEKVQEVVDSVGALLWYLPPYSPDLNPIEECFSKVKKYLTSNSIAYQSTENPRILVSAAFGTVTQSDCLGYICHAGYCI